MTDVGRTDPIKKWLMSQIKLVDPSLTDIGSISHVTPDWRDFHKRLNYLPSISVRLTDATIDDAFYGRNRESNSENESSEVTLTFSLHIHCSNCQTSGEAKGKYALELGDKIMTYFKQNNKNTVYGVYDISDLKMRESDLGEGFNVSRVIVEGVIWAKRPDS